MSDSAQMPCDSMIFVDSDNALGGGRGNVDDGFAIAALLLAGAPVVGIGSVAGNATEEQADRNNRAVGRLCGYGGLYFKGGEAAAFLAEASAPMRIAALGPLTNIAAAIQRNERTEQWCSDLVVVGGNTVSRGRWPPWWPYEFNLTQDVEASRRAFDSPIPWTIVPIDVLDNLSVGRSQLAQISEPLGGYLREHSERRLTGKSRFRLGDLIAAMYMLEPQHFELERMGATMHRNGWIDFRRGSKEVSVVRDFNGELLWQRFVQIVNGAASR